MKRLTITYDDRTLFDADIAEFTWSESDTDITVRGSTVPKPSLVDTLHGAAEKAARNRDITVNDIVRQ